MTIQMSEALMKKAIKDPTKLYDTPHDVLADTKLSNEQKRKILESWHMDAEALMRAEEENMTSTDKTNKTSKLFELIKEAERKLDESFH
jgi:hypothetical protein